MNLNEQFEKALLIATAVHEGQIRLNGDPYILHPLRVALKCKNKFSRVVAILHDVIEDSNFDEEDLKARGISEEVSHIVMILTHREKESYEDYIKRVVEDSVAIEVKMHDLEDNMDILQLPEMTDLFATRLQKYHKAYKFFKNRKN